MSNVQKIVVVYPGRFQPFHVGHYNTYKAIVKNFGQDNVFIGTSDKTDKLKSPLNFKEKEMVITTMFPDLAGRVVQVKNPYAPKEVFQNYDPETTAFVTVVSEKDAKRLGGKYFTTFRKGMKMSDMEGFNDKGYVWVADKKAEDELFNGEVISGTLVRSILGDKEKSDAEKEDLFKALYDGKFNPKVFRLLTSKIVKESFKSKSFDKFIQIMESREGLRITESSESVFGTLLLESVSYPYDLISEGGAFGHLAHPYEEINMTFGQMKDLITDVLDNNIEYNVEKTDGQNLMITYKDGHVRAARNKGHLKNNGENSLTVDGISDMFAGRGEIQDAYVAAMQDLETAIQKLPSDKVQELFQEGKNFMTLEVIYPKNTNVIPYGHSLLVFQGIVSHDIEGNALEYSREQAKKLADMISDINANVQDEFEIMMQPSLELPKNTEPLKKKYTAQIDSIKKKYNLTDGNQIKDYLTHEWTKYIDNLPYEISDELKLALINRWVYGSKQPNIRQLKAMGSKEFDKWITGFEKKEIKKVQKEIRKPFEMTFLKLGADVLKEIKSVLTLNHRESTDKMIADLEKVIKDVRATKDPNKIEKLEAELQRLEDLGGFDSIVPIEGIVFSKNDTLYKLTGSFAATNQILGLLKYSR